MKAFVKTVKTPTGENQALEDSLHFSLTVDQLANSQGQFNDLKDSTVLQTYIQILNPEKSSSGGKYYENYTSSIKFVQSDYGKVQAAKYLDQIQGKGASCGTAVLGLITSGDYTKTQGEEVDKCGFYKPDLEAM